MVPGLPHPPNGKDTASVEGCPYCARCTVGEDCPWCGHQTLCDLCGVCFTEGCGYTRPEEESEVVDLLSERGQNVQEFGRRLMAPLPELADELLREGGA